MLAIVRRLEARNAALEKRIETQDKRIHELEAALAKARKNSSTSSKPPSSDIVKPPRPRGAGKRKIGGQPGHPKHERPPFPPEAVNQSWIYTPTACPTCDGHGVPTEEPPHRVQQVDLVASPLWITEHVCPIHKCVGCG